MIWYGGGGGGGVGLWHVEHGMTLSRWECCPRGVVVVLEMVVCVFALGRALWSMGQDEADGNVVPSCDGNASVDAGVGVCHVEHERGEADDCVVPKL